MGTDYIKRLRKRVADANFLSATEYQLLKVEAKVELMRLAKIGLKSEKGEAV